MARVRAHRSWRTRYVGSNSRFVDLLKRVSQIAREKIMRFDHERIPEVSRNSWNDAMIGPRTRHSVWSMPVARVPMVTSKYAFISVVSAYALICMHMQVFDNRASKYTFAPVLTDPSRITPTFVRFSTVQSSRGGAVSLQYKLCPWAAIA